MIERLPRHWRNLVLVLLGALVLWFAWSIRAVLNPLLVGYLGAFILHPLVERVQQLGFARRTAVNLVFLSGFLLAVGIGLGLAFETRALVFELSRGHPVEEVVPAEGAPSGAAGEEGAAGGAAAAPAHEVLVRWQGLLQDRVDAFLARLNGWFGTTWEFEVPGVTWMQEQLSGYLERHGQAAGGVGLWAAGRTLDLLGGLLAMAGLLLLVPLYCYYLLFELERVHGFLVRYIPHTERRRLAGVATQIGEVIAAFFRGRLSVCLFKGLFLSAALWAAGIDYALLFGMLSGLLSLIPFVGPALGFLFAFVYGIVDHGVLSSLARVGVVFLLGELLEGYVLIPRILGDSLGLHPVVVIFAIFAGGASLGTLGIVLALPLTASAVILVRELVLPALQRVADEEPAPAPPPPGEGS